MEVTDLIILDLKGKKYTKGMGRGRTPCCDAHVNRGPWSPAEDLRLISFIQKYGHDNWRALPKQAGLRRCGKSCRLRWVNYLRPDLKRGNFTKEEEEAIFQLHQSLGNKWSKIAVHLPGRTDNEIKNVWNTHLKKKLSQTANKAGMNMESSVITSSSSSSSTVESNLNHQKIEIDSQINTQPHFCTMKIGQMEFPKINDFGSMNQISDPFLDSNGVNQQLEDFTLWKDPNLLDSLLKAPSFEFDTEPDFDLWGMLNLNDNEKDEFPTADTSMIGKNTDTGDEYITDQEFDSLLELESLENVSEVSQVSSGMYENSTQYLVDVPECSSSVATSNANGVKEMANLDFFTVWPSSPI